MVIGTSPHEPHYQIGLLAIQMHGVAKSNHWCFSIEKSLELFSKRNFVFLSRPDSDLDYAT